MANELAFVLINPYTIAKSRTGGVIGRFLSRTGLELVAARMFAPSRKLVEEYAQLVRESDTMELSVRHLVSDYILKSYMPNPEKNLPQRILMLLFEGEDAIKKVRDMAGPVKMGGSETIRDTFGDYVVNENGRVQYFEPAVLIGSNREETSAALKLWSRYSASDGGIIRNAADFSNLEHWQQTLVLIKPDNFRFPNARPGNIVDMLSRSGLRIIAAKVHRMSVNEAEEFYKPVREALRNKMKDQIAEKACRAIEAEFNMKIPSDITLLLAEHLSPVVGDKEFNQLIKFMTGYYPPDCTEEQRQQQGLHKCLALVYGGVNAIEIIRNLVGPTDPSKAKPGSVRRELGSDIMINAAHASDSTESSKLEMGIIRMEEDTICKWVKKYYGS